MFKAKFFLVVIIILCSYLYFTNPNGIAITKEGKVDGLINKGRAILQSGKFWELQLERANEKYNKRFTPDESMTSMMQEFDQITQEVNKDADEFSTPEQQKAVSLRREAERIEREGTYREIDEWTEKNRLETIDKCQIIIPKIEARLLDIKISYTPIFLLICLVAYAILVIITKHQKAIALTKRLKSEEYFDKGIMLYNRQQYKEAIASYTIAIENRPDCKFAYINRAHAKEKLQDYIGAIEDYTNFIKINPMYLDSYFERGTAKHYNQDFKGAISDYNKLIEMNANDLNFHNRYALTYHYRGLSKIELGQKDDAYLDFSKARDLGYTEPR